MFTIFQDHFYWGAQPNVVTEKLDNLLTYPQYYILNETQ